MERHMVVLKSFKRMDQELEQILRLNFTPLSIKKGQVLQEPRTLNNCLYFIEKGLLHFFMEKNGRHITVEFRREDQFFIASTSICDTENADGIEALEDCTLWCLPAAFSEELCDRNHRFDLQYQEILLRQHMVSKQFVRCSHSHGGPANLDNLRSYFPELISRVPLKYLSSLTEVSEHKLKHLIESPIKLQANLNRRLGTR